MISTDHALQGPHGDLRLRVYRPVGQVMSQGLVWVHGGAFAGGDLDMAEADWVSSELAQRGFVVASVDYQRAPMPEAWSAEFNEAARTGVHYPVARQEVEHAYAWARKNIAGPRSWAIGGASAGANLAVGATLVMLHARRALPSSIVLAYPTLLAIQPPPSRALRKLLDRHPAADRFGPEQIREMYENYLGRAAEDADVYAAPAKATEQSLRGLPPVLMINNEIDELRVSAELFANKLRGAAVTLAQLTEPMTTHGHLSRPHEVAAQKSITDIARWLCESDHEQRGLDEELSHSAGLCSPMSRTT